MAQTIDLGPVPLEDKLAAADAELGLPKGFTKAQMHVESSGDYKKVNPATGAAGLFQIMPSNVKTYSERVGRQLDPHNEDDALYMRNELMKENLKYFKNLDKAAAGYHGGPNTEKWGKRTQGYYPAIERTMAKLRAESNMPTTSAKVIDLGPVEQFHKGEPASAGTFPNVIDLGPVSDFEAPKEESALKKAGKFLKESFNVGMQQVGNTADTALTMAAATLAPKSAQEDLFKNLQAREQSRQQYWNPNNVEQGVGGKVASALLTLPMQVATMPISPVMTGKRGAELGESPENIKKAMAVDAALTAAGVVIPGAAGTKLLTKAATGAGVNAAQELASKTAISNIYETPEAKQEFAPNAADTAVAALLGGGLGAASYRRPASASVDKIDAALEATKVPEPVAPEPVKQLTYEPSFIDETGKVVKGELTPEALQHKAVLEQQADLQKTAALEQAKQGELFDTTPVKEPVKASLMDETTNKPLDRTEYQKTLQALADEPITRFKLPENIDEAYAKYQEQVGGKQLDMFEQRVAAAQAIIIDQAVQQHPQVKAANVELQQAKQALNEAETAGDIVKVAAAEKAVVKAEKLAATVQKNVTKTFSGFGSKQRGHVNFGVSEAIVKQVEKIKDHLKSMQDVARTPTLNGQPIDPSVLKKNPAITKGYADMAINKAPIEKVVEAAKIAKDIDKNALDKLTDQLVMGSTHTKMKYNHPVVDRVVDAFQTARTNIRGIQHALLEGSMLPALRALKNTDFIDLWTMMTENQRQIMAHEANPSVNPKVMPLTTEALQKAGFDPKVIKAFEATRKALDTGYDMINKARAAVNKPPVDRRAAYLAGVFTGDFKRVLYTVDKEGNKSVAAVIGANSKAKLNQRINAVKEMHPDWSVGELQQTYKSKKTGKTQEVFQQVLEFLSENDPNMKSVLDTLDAVLAKEGYDYRNAKKHTMQKKGVMGSEGDKFWQSAYENAKEGFNAQVNYVKKAIEWAEMSQAMKEVRPLLTDKDILNNSPKAVAWAEDYSQRAMGLNPSKVAGPIADAVNELFANVAGIGPSHGMHPAQITRVTRNLVTQKLIGFVNLSYNMTNLIQGTLQYLPEMARLASRGDISIDPVTLSKYNFATSKLISDFVLNKSKLSKADAEIFQAGKDRGIMHMEYFEHSNDIRKDFNHYWNKIAELGSSQAEAMVRNYMFIAFSKLLQDAKAKGAEGLKTSKDVFDVAERAVDNAMGNRARSELPRIFQVSGQLGQMAGNLTKFNYAQMSQLSSYAREWARGGSPAPLGIALAGTVLAVGLQGFVAYDVLDQLYQFITGKLGKPDTLTAAYLRLADKVAQVKGEMAGNFFSSGMFGAAGVALQNRMGYGNIVPDSPVQALLGPSASVVPDVANAVGDVISNPNTVNAARAGLAVLPNSIGNVIEPYIMPEDARPEEQRKGTTMSYNKKAGKPIAGQYARTPTEKLMKQIGFTGIDEYKTRTKEYQDSLVTKAMKDIREGIIYKLTSDIASNPTTPPVELFQKYKDKYLAAEGDDVELTKELVKFKTGLVTTAQQRNMLRIAEQANTRAGKAMEAKRRYGQ